MDELLEIKGFHTTTQEFAEKIKKEGFIPSNKPNEWLGKGVYFWCEYDDATFWVKSSHKNINEMCILFVNITEKAQNFLDLDIYENMQNLLEFIKKVEADFPKCKKKPQFKSNEELRCFYCELYKKYKNVNILSYSFNIDGYNSAGFPNKRRQLCVSDTKCVTICKSQKIRKDDLYVIQRKRNT